jgi:hypothetical protein
MTGIVEGFYGKPYSPSQRASLLKLLSGLDRPGYVYAPKDDPWHRMRWREDYPYTAWRLIECGISRACRLGVDFFFGISPWEFRTRDARMLRNKASRALDWGACGVAVLFDDIDGSPSGELAGRQADIAIEALDGICESVIVCPSVYCCEQAARPGAMEYLSRFGAAIPCHWGVFWTGSDVISPSLDAAAEGAAVRLLGRAPVIWDNLLADDYALRRVFLGPLGERVSCGSHYFMNPSACFPVATRQAAGLVSSPTRAAADAAAAGKGWDVMGMFHHLPWSASTEGARLLDRMHLALDEQDASAVLAEVGDALAGVETLSGEGPAMDGGFDLMPYVLDVSRFLSIWKRALAEPPGDRRGTLSRLLLERLPYEHPLAEATRKAIRGGGE